jgi:hypothetical protein
VTDAQARELVAEGLLCRGIVRDDPWALAAAIGAFETLIAAHPGDFFAQLYRAEALRRRFPLADESEVAFERAREVLTTADVGAARPALEAHVRESLDAVRLYREQYSPMLKEREAALAQGTLSAAELIELLTLLPQTGPSGVNRASAILEAQLGRQQSELLATFYRAEIFRGIRAAAELAPLYSSAATSACAHRSMQIAHECQRARWRLHQLEDQPAARGKEDHHP